MAPVSQRVESCSSLLCKLALCGGKCALHFCDLLDMRPARQGLEVERIWHEEEGKAPL
jgi:hypothetical protein